MADHNINIGINFGNSNASFQQLIDNNNRLQGIVTQLGNTIQEFGSKVAGSNSKGQKSITDYAGAYSTLTADIKKNREELIEELQVLEKLRAAKATDTKVINDQIARTKQLETTIRDQTVALNQYNKALGITKVESAALGGVTGSLIKGFNSLGAVLGISFGLYGAFRILKESITTISEFEIETARLTAILGDTEEGMKGIIQSAIDIGKASIFGAKGVTELQIVLAKMGFGKDEIMSMQQSIVNLATATHEELEPTAVAVTQILRVFNLTSGDTARVVDVMGSAFLHSALTLQSFQEAIKYSAIPAATAKFTIEELTASLETLSRLNIRGSIAGTTMANVMKAMANPASKLAQALGYTTSGFEGFVKVLQTAVDKGWDYDKMSQLITQRAAAGFMGLTRNVDLLRDYLAKAQLSSGAVAEQAQKELDTIHNKAKVAGEALKSMVLGLDSGNGIASNTIKSFLDLFTALISKQKSLSDNFIEQRKTVYDLQKEIAPLINRYAQLTNNLDPLFDKTKLNKSEQEELGVIIKKVGEAIPGAVSAFDEYGNAIAINANKAYEFIQIQTSVMRILNKSALEDAEGILLKIGGELNSARKVYELILKTGEITTATGQSVNVRKATQEEIATAQQKFAKLAQEYKDYQNYIKSLNGDALKEEIAFRKKMDVADGSDETAIDGTDAQKKRLKAEIDLLEAQKKTAAEKIKLDYNGHLQSIKLADNDYDYNKKIEEKKLELAIASGDDIALAHQKSAEELRQIDLKLSNDYQDAFKKLGEINLKDDINILESKKKAADGIVKAEYDGYQQQIMLLETSLYWDKQILDKKEELAKLSGGNIVSIEQDFAEQRLALQATFDGAYDDAMDKNEKKIQDDFIKHFEKLTKIWIDNDEKLQKFQKDHPIWAALGFKPGDEEQIKFAEEGLKVMKNELTGMVDSWVSSLDKIVEAKNQMVDEAQSALQTEIELAQAGFANNVTLRRKDLEDAKAARKLAIKDQQDAQKIQLAIDSATQASSLAVTIANYFESASKSPNPIVGIILAIATITTLLGTFAKFKALAKEQAATQYETGGWIGGRRHSQGGTHIEAETGEYIINRKSAAKHSKMIEAINNDDKITMNRLYINGLKNGILHTSVSLDDSQDLKAIRIALEKRGTDITYGNGYRIERTGNITTRIRMN